MEENNADFQVRTDLAVETKDMYVEKQENKQDGQIKGVTIKEHEQDNIKISYVEIDDEGAALIDKKKGTYITIYADGVKKQDTDKQEAAAKILAKELEQLMAKNNIPKDATDRKSVV